MASDRPGGPAEAPAARLELSTCTLLHPEHDLHTFVERDYARLRAVCKVLTLYMDRRDQALALSEVINRTPSLGKHPFALVEAVRPLERTLSMRHAARGYASAAELAFKPSATHPPLDVDGASPPARARSMLHRLPCSFLGAMARAVHRHPSLCIRLLPPIPQSSTRAGWTRTPSARGMLTST